PGAGAEGRRPRPRRRHGADRQEQAAALRARLPSDCGFSYGACAMAHVRRATGKALVALVMMTLLAAMAPLALASDSATRLIDGEGVIHVTNVPEDPRYRALARSSGTAVGWLRLPARRLADYATDIREISRQHGVSATLVESVIRTESGFDPSAGAPQGAAGAVQLMAGAGAAPRGPGAFGPPGRNSGGGRRVAP